MVEKRGYNGLVFFIKIDKYSIFVNMVILVN